MFSICMRQVSKIFIRGNIDQAHLLQRYILALTELDLRVGGKGEPSSRTSPSLHPPHQVLDPINNLQTTSTINEPDVSRVEPSIGVNRLLSLVGVVKVLGDDGRATSKDLSTRVRLVGGEVAHVRNVAKADLDTSRGRTDGAIRVVVAFVAASCGSTVLGLTVSIYSRESAKSAGDSEGPRARYLPLRDVAAQSHLEEGENVRVDGRRACTDPLNVASESHADL
jgi:hypothetical protein